MRNFHLLGAVAALWVGVSVALNWYPAPIRFNTLSELQPVAVSRGLFAYQDARSPLSWNTFVVADHPLTANNLWQLKGMRMREYGVLPAWKGILGVSEIDTQDRHICIETIACNWRIWGNLLVIGDEELMNRIERLSRRH